MNPDERAEVIFELNIREHGVGAYAMEGREPMLQLLNYLIAREYVKIPYAQWLDIVEQWRPIYAQIASMNIYWDISDQLSIEASSEPGPFVQLSHDTYNGVIITNTHEYASLHECIKSLHDRVQPHCFILNGEDILPRFRGYVRGLE